MTVARRLLKDPVGNAPGDGQSKTFGTRYFKYWANSLDICVDC